MNILPAFSLLFLVLYWEVTESSFHCRSRSLGRRRYNLCTRNRTPFILAWFFSGLMGLLVVLLFVPSTLTTTGYWGLGLFLLVSQRSLHKRPYWEVPEYPRFCTWESPGWILSLPAGCPTQYPARPREGLAHQQWTGATSRGRCHRTTFHMGSFSLGGVPVWLRAYGGPQDAMERQRKQLVSD